jgi:hypothetical protein
MTKTEIDVMWSRALREALEGGEEFTRYRFAAMVASAQREACAEAAGIALLGADRALTERVLKAIQAKGQA